jgi:hypothetical protein
LIHLPFKQVLYPRSLNAERRLPLFACEYDGGAPNCHRVGERSRFCVKTVERAETPSTMLNCGDVAVDLDCTLSFREQPDHFRVIF